MKTKIFLLATLPLLSPLNLNAEKDTSYNKSFIKVIAKNRAYQDKDNSNHTKIDTKKEFLESLEKNKKKKPINNKSVTKEYVYTEINNVNIKKSDLKHIQDKELNLGTEVKNGNVVKVLNIKNSTIKSDKKINLAVNVDGNAKGSVTSITNINKSKIVGKKKKKGSNLLPLD
ncbi:MAG TPA: hypothetical protein ENK66_05795 [Arcobacter sp.]|nr:hypothetical protein [Arcobacter sp.]